MKKVKEAKEAVAEKIKRQNEPEKLGEEKVPRITNKTVNDHREEVLSGARKFIYPLQHPKRYIVGFTTALVIVVIIAFFTTTTLALYRYHTTSNFMYRVTQVVPFPIARSGNTFVAYENYLFELRHYIHYYETQQNIDFDTDVGQQQLDEFRRRALDKVINDAYVKKIANQHDIRVTNQEVEEQIELVRQQDRLGTNNQVLEDVLRDFWDWSLDDFRRSLSQQLLAQKVVAALDTETQAIAQEAYDELEAGMSFEDAVEAYSDDPATAAQGGEFGFDITRTSRDIAPQTVDALFRLEPGETSEVINIGYALQIVKLLERDGDTVRAAHILFGLEDIDTFINEAKEEEPSRVYIRLPESQTTGPEQEFPLDDVSDEEEVEVED